MQIEGGKNVDLIQKYGLRWQVNMLPLVGKKYNVLYPRGIKFIEAV